MIMIVGCLEGRRAMVREIDRESENLSDRKTTRWRLSRRQILRSAVGGSVTLAFGGLLAACGGSSKSTATSAGTSSSTSAAAATTGGAATPSSGAATPQSTSGSTATTNGPAPQSGGQLIYALTNKFDTLDPTITTNTDVIRVDFSIFDPLIWSPKAGEFIPGLSTKWEVSPTADQYTFHLRDDVKFHDDTAFNADAIKFTFDRIVDPNMKSQVAFSLIGPYDSTTVSDPQTAVVKFKSAFAPFLASCAQSALAPLSPTAVQKYGNDFNFHPVGTGPFMFDSYTTDNFLNTVKNPNYNWAPSMFKHQGPPNLDSIKWRIIPEPATRLAALQSGEVHFIQDVPTQNYKDLQNSGSIGLLQGVSAGSPYSMMINVTKAPTDEVAVRQALEWGVDKEAMIKALWQGLYTPASSILTDNMFGYDPATKDIYHYDAKKAGEVLDAAGWKMGSNNVRQKDGKDLVLSLYYRSDNADFVGMATFLLSMYQPIGIKIDLHGLAQAGYFDAVRAGQHNLQFWNETTTDPDVVRELLYSANADGGTNRNRYKNADMDKLIDEAAGTTDPAERTKFYAQIQKKVLDEAIMVPFANVVTLFAYQKNKVNGAELDWSSNFPFFYDTSMK
jgi:peptide/nickel transport system substrate-binding protein